MISAAYRAQRSWLKIQRKPVSIVFTRPKIVHKNGTVTAAAVLAAQTVRINSDNRASVTGGAAGLVPTRAVIIYGVTSHPTQAANDIREGYTFQYEGDTYRVEDIIPGTPGVIQAQATATG